MEWMMLCLQRQVLESDFMEDHKEVLLVALVPKIFLVLHQKVPDLEEQLRMEFSHTLIYTKIISVLKEKVLMDGRVTSTLNLLGIFCITLRRE